MQVLKTEKDQLERKVSDLQKSLAMEKRNFEEEKKEKEKALTRLSAVAGDKLRVNNPGIADLSDENRPNKLAEKFSELYDNEWTELYEVLEESGQTEEDIIGNLLQILQETYNSSNNLAENQRRELKKVILHPANVGSREDIKPPEGILSKITDIQKQTASIVFGDVRKEIMESNKLISDGMNEVKRKYVERCIQLCWMMAIQDPPMHLDFGPSANSEADKNVYRMYTKQGDKVDFVVWPAVFLHNQGPLVQKGVLQPK
ncbi:uncharacterized protein LOC133191854 [Saccostrea echinata]|uniref:uncharacterized protein LOC133191854 n=1 Tax=Saccostrea echinata TaxID=191078 RepID=UPI002A806394|nr:uncharacterized protein LOC133191854 [Saccostrea echinata]